MVTERSADDTMTRQELRTPEGKIRRRAQLGERRRGFRSRGLCGVCGRKTNGGYHCERCRARHAATQQSKSKTPQYREYRRKARINAHAKRFGLTVEEYLKLRAQKHCDICGRRGERLHIDHDHQTKRVRGMLCRHCNMGLGFLCDDPSLLRRAIAYLERGARILPFGMGRVERL